MTIEHLNDKNELDDGSPHDRIHITTGSSVASCYVCLLNSDLQAVIGPTRRNEISQGFAFLRERMIRLRHTRRLQRSEKMSGRMRGMVPGLRIAHEQSSGEKMTSPSA